MDHGSRASAPLLSLGTGGWFCPPAGQQLLLLTFSAPCGLLPRCPMHADPRPSLCTLGAGAGAVLAQPRPRAAAGRWLGALPWDGGRPSPCSALRARQDGAPRGRLQPHPAMPLGRIKQNYSRARRHEPQARPHHQPGHNHSNSAAGPISACVWAGGRGLLPAPRGTGSPQHGCRHRAAAGGPPCHKTPARQKAPRKAAPGRRLPVP